MQSLLDSSNQQKLNKFMNEEWSENDKRILVALLKQEATVRNVYQLRNMLDISTGFSLDTEKKNGSAADDCCFGGAYAGGSMGAYSASDGSACAVISLCFFCFACFGMTVGSANFFYNSCKNDYAFVKLAKVFLLAVSTMGLYMVSQNYIVEEVDSGISSSQNNTSPASRSSSSDSLSTTLINDAIVVGAMVFGVPALLMLFSLLSPTQRFSLRDQLIAEGVSDIDTIMNTPTDEIQPSAVSEKHKFVAKSLLGLMATKSGLKKASGLLDSLMQSSVADSSNKITETNYK